MEGVNSTVVSHLRPPRAPHARASSFSISGFGCKVNQYETQLMRETLGAFVSEAGEGERADLVVVNTCAVTAEAERQGKQALRRARRRHPGAFVIAAGCAARRPGADLVSEGLADAVVNAPTPAAIISAAGFPTTGKVPAGITRLAGHSRAFVKIQDGCDRRCSFCIVPLIRGSSASRPAADIVKEVRGLAAAGIPEVVLCGVELSAWRDPGAGMRLAGLIGRLVAIPDLARLRLSSLYPGKQPEELVSLLTGHSKVCRHLHLPVQSGSDAVLRAMRRGYDSAGILSLVRDLKSRDPGIGLTADIVVGFPGETEDDARATERLVEECGFHRLHLFPFSARPGTPAAEMPAPAAAAVSGRMGRLRGLGARLRKEALDRSVGAEVEAVVERGGPGRTWRGTTGTYLPVVFRDPAARPGAISRLRITGHRGGELAGVPAEGGR